MQIILYLECNTSVILKRKLPIPTFYHGTLRVSAVYADASYPSVCPSLCLSVTFVYCIQMAEDIVKLLSRPGSPIIRVFLPQAPYPNPRRILSAGAQNARDRKKCNFRLKSPFTSATVRDRTIVAMER